MKKNYWWIILCCIAMLIATSGSIASAKKNKRNKVQFLFVQTAKSGSLVEISPGELTLTLNDILPSTIWFTDRPQRVTGSLTTSSFVEQGWATFDFNEDPPNAALEAEFEDDTRSVITLELESPEYDSLNNKITYMAMLLDGEPTEALAHLHTSSNSELSGSFEHSVLFIDDADLFLNNLCMNVPDPIGCQNCIKNNPAIYCFPFFGITSF